MKANTCRVCGEPVLYRSGLSSRIHSQCRPKRVATKTTRTVPAYKLTRVVSTRGETRPNADVANGNHRSNALRKSANGERCVACGVKDQTVVWAHSNEGEHGKGKSIKAHDLLGNYLCATCHLGYDQGSAMNREQKRAFFRECYPKTMVRVAEKLVAGELRL